MDFFEHQDNARKSSRRLTFLFILAAISIVAILNFVIISSFIGFNSNPYVNVPFSLSLEKFKAVPWQTHALVSGSILAIILLASIFKLLELRGGGSKVAEALGGKRLLTNDTLNVQEQQLINVIEEMAIAAGTQRPDVYVIEDSAINAFAAGLTTHDAVIGVTRGAIDLLNREEMQGVIAHEFSHILHGDMRLNVKMIGILFGLTFFANAGAQLMRFTTYSVGSYRSSSSVNGGARAVLIFIGLAVVIFGYIGVFFASMIKAAISRQREYLADASAVKYTRNLSGIAGALKKIGGWSIGSHLSAKRAADYSHFYISEGVPLYLRGFFSTHPPLPKRIKRIEPNWDGEFPYVKRTHEQIKAVQTRKKQDVFASPENVIGNTIASSITVASLTEAIAHTGMPNDQHVQYAHDMINNIPIEVLAAARKPISAYALVLLLLINDDLSNWQTRLKNINQDFNRTITPEVLKLVPLLNDISPLHRLPLIEMAIPAIKEMHNDQQGIFKSDVIQVIKSNDKLELWEWALYRIISLALNPPAPYKVKYQHFTQLESQCHLLLKAISIAGSNDKTQRRKAFATASESLGISTEFPEQASMRTSDLKTALHYLAQIQPLQKPRLLKAFAMAAEHDGIVDAKEVELIRAIADSIDCPMPPILN